MKEKQLKLIISTLNEAVTSWAQRVMVVYLGELPGNTDGPAEAVAADEQGLHAPAPEMAESKNVKVAQDSLPGDDVAVHSVLLQGRGEKKRLVNDDG